MLTLEYESTKQTQTSKQNFVQYRNIAYFIAISALTVDTIHRVNSVSIASQKLQTTAM